MPYVGEVTCCLRCPEPAESFKRLEGSLTLVLMLGECPLFSDGKTCDPLKADFRLAIEGLAVPCSPLVGTRCDWPVDCQPGREFLARKTFQDIIYSARRRLDDSSSAIARVGSYPNGRGVQTALVCSLPGRESQANSCSQVLKTT
jgi:hypothetical protein